MFDGSGPDGQQDIGTPPLTRGADLNVEDVEQMSTIVDNVIVSSGPKSRERRSYNNLQCG